MRLQADLETRVIPNHIVPPFDSHTLITYSQEKNILMNATMIALPQYEARIAGLLNADEILDMESAIAADPEAHPVIPQTGGVRKARWARTGKGKSGGVRVIYYYVGQRGVVFMITAFPKSRKANLSKQEQNDLYKLAKVLKNETL